MLSSFPDTNAISRVSTLMELIRHAFRDSDFVAIESALHHLDVPEAWRRREDIYTSRIDELTEELRRRDALCESYVELRASHADLEASSRRRIEELEAELETKGVAYEEVLELKAKLLDLEESGRGKSEDLSREVREKEEIRGAYEKTKEEYAQLKGAYEKTKEEYAQLKGAYVDLEDAKIAAEEWRCGEMEEEVREWRRRYGELEAKMLRTLATDPGLRARWSGSGKGDGKKNKEVGGVWGGNLKEEVCDVAIRSMKKEAIFDDKEVNVVECGRMGRFGGDVIEISDGEVDEKDGEVGGVWGGNLKEEVCDVAIRSMKKEAIFDDEEVNVVECGRMGRFGGVVIEISDGEVDEKDGIDNYKEEGGAFGKDSLTVVTPRRKRALKLVVIESESEDSEDRIPDGKLKARRLGNANEVDGGESIGLMDRSLERSSGHTVLSEFASRSSRRLVQLSQRMEANGRAKGTKSPVNDKAGGFRRACRKLDFREAEIDDEAKVYGEVDGNNTMSNVEAESESEGESLGGFIVDDSDVSEIKFLTSSASEESERRVTSCNVASRGASTLPNSSEEDNEVDSDSAFGKVLGRIRRENKSPKWEYEADMLASFSKSPELCMKAVCALYRQQTIEEQSAKSALRVNQRGFNKLDAYRGSRIAQFLLDDHPHGPARKSVQDLEEYDAGGMEFCHKLAARYSKQLFTIYQNKEDPYFGPPSW